MIRASREELEFDVRIDNGLGARIISKIISGGSAYVPAGELFIGTVYAPYRAYLSTKRVRLRPGQDIAVRMRMPESVFPVLFRFTIANEPVDNDFYLSRATHPSYEIRNLVRGPNQPTPLAAGKWELELAKDGCKTKSLTVVVDISLQPQIVRVDMAPRESGF